MSSRQYTISIKLKDSDGLLKKLETINGYPAGGKSSLLGGAGSTDIFKKLETLNGGQLLKLTGIGVGIGSLVAVATKSSGILQSTFKMWETSMTLVFKPIADFIGLMLRPITLALLQQMVIPFYKSMYPFFRDNGKAIGQFFSDPSKALTTLAEAIGGTVALALASKGIGIPTPSAPSTPSASPPATGPSISGGCVELCGKTIGNISKPMTDGVRDGIGQSNLIGTITAIGATTLLINSSLLDMKTDLRLLKDSSNNILNRMPFQTTTSAGKDILVDISDKLSITDIFGSDVTSGIKNDWGQAAIASASVAAAAAEAARHLDEAKIALGGAVARLQSYASSIPNSFSWGFAQFGSGGMTPVSASRARTQMAAIADAVQI